MTLIRMLEGRRSEDVFKTYYRANEETDVKRLAESTGFAPTKIQLIAFSAEFAIISPLTVIELLWIRVLLTRSFRHLRTNLIVTLTKERATNID